MVPGGGGGADGKAFNLSATRTRADEERMVRGGGEDDCP